MEKKKKIILIAVISVIVVALIIVGVFLIGNTKKDLAQNNEESNVFKSIYEQDGKLYFSDANGNITIFSEYDKIYDFHNDLAVAYKSVDGKRKYTIINKSGKQVIKLGEYDSIDQIDEIDGIVYFKVEKNDLYGVIDSKGKTILPIEYNEISAFDNIHIFRVKKDNKYYYLSQNGNVMCETEKTSIFDTVTYYKRFNDNYDYLVEIEDNYYNARTGELVFSNKSSIKFEYNVLYEDKKISLYDKNLKLKVEIPDQDIISMSVNKTESDHIVIMETIKNGNSSYYKYRIYDENLNQKKELTSTTVKSLSFSKIGENYFSIVEKEPDGTKDSKYTLTLFDKNLKETKRESSRSINAMVTSKGEIVFIECDYSKNIVYIYDVNGKEVASIENSKIETNYKTGDYIAVTQTKTSPKTYEIYNIKGELVSKDVTTKDALSDTIIRLKRNSGDNSVIFENGKEIINKDYSFTIQGESIIANNSKEKQVKIYDKLGNLKIEYSNISQITNRGDRYILLKGDSKYIVYNTKSNKQVFEFDISSYKTQYNDRGVYVIELEDAFYTFEGKKIIDKK